MTARLEIVATPGSRAPGISRRGPDVIVAVRERAIEGKANAAVTCAVAAWLDVAPSRVQVVRGGTARRKLLAIDGLDDDTLRRHVAVLATGAANG